MKIVHTSEMKKIQFVHDRLYEYNLSKTKGKKLDIVLSAPPERKAFVVEDGISDSPLGGLVYDVDSASGQFNVEFLWISDALRGHGMGSKLLAAAREEAVRLGCTAIELYTNTFQAPDFYPKMGFTLIRKETENIPGYGENSTFYFEMKLK